MVRNKNRNSKLRPRLTYFMFVLAVAVGGTLLTVLSHASTPYSSLEAESGNLTNGAALGSDSEASGDKYVQFGVSTSSSSNSVMRGVNDETLYYTLGYGDGYGPVNEPQSSYTYLASRGLKIVRLQISWGSLQSALAGPLNASYLADIQTEVNRIHTAGMATVLDLHSSGRWPNDTGSPYVWGGAGGNNITEEQAADIWIKLSNTFKNDPGVIAYDLANEPYEQQSGTSTTLTTAIVHTYQQYIVSAIRNNGDSKLLWIEGGNDYSGASDWETDNGATPWISDPDNNIMYSAHDYPPSSNGGTWSNTTFETSDSSWTNDLTGSTGFVTWLNANHVRGSLGEIGVPAAATGTNQQEWNNVLNEMYTIADSNNLWVTYFCAGSAFNEPNLAYDNDTSNTVELNSKPGTVPGINHANYQAPIIEAHPSYIR
jgi:endoglucanase